METLTSFRTKSNPAQMLNVIEIKIAYKIV